MRRYVVISPFPLTAMPSREDVVQKDDDLLGGQALCGRRAASDVGEEDRDFVVSLRDHLR
ncbi:MAG: hypothetical protein ACRDNI_11875 [Gaiellaceae bacterium]